MAAVKCFEEMITQYFLLRKEQDEALEGNAHIHYANSSAIRLANIYARHPVWCNRGVNGIEGSLSTAAGFSLATRQQGQPTFCVVGDLSFFYDQNALWNQELGGNLRILLLNNGGGGIFSQLKGLADSPAHHLVAGTHHTSAEGICRQNNVGYLHANNIEQLYQGIEQLITMKSQRPVLLEVFTDSQDDLQAYNSYYKLR